MQSRVAPAEAPGARRKPPRVSPLCGLPPFVRSVGYAIAVHLTIANDVRYSNPSHFAQLFRKQTNLPPIDYRKQQ